MSNSIAELENAPFILIIGSNTTESHPVIALRIKKAVRNGAKLVVVDPRKIGLVKFAHRWLKVNIGADIALLNAMMHVIIKEGLYNQDFVQNHTEGFEDLARFVENYTPEYAERITGIRAEDIRATAREYAQTEHSCGTHNVLSLSNLSLLLGNFGKESAGVNPLRGQNNVQGAGDMGALPNSFVGYQKVFRKEIAEKFERAWSASLPREPGLKKIEVLDKIHSGEVRAVYIMGENTVISDANAQATKKAFEAVEFLVVQDLFLTQTAQLADVVLPAAGWGEVDGSYTNTERRVQRVRAGIKPPGQAHPDTEILCDLSTRLGYPMRYDSSKDIWEEAASLSPILAGINYDRIEGVGIQWPCPNPSHPGTKYLHSDIFVDKVGHFQPVPHEPPAETPNAEYPLLLTTGRRLQGYHTGTFIHHSSGFDEIWKEEFLEVNPQDAIKIGISDGDKVRVISRRGEVSARASVAEKSPVGTVFLSFHFPDQVWTNALTIDAYDPITGTAEYKACAVRVEKLT